MNRCLRAAITCIGTTAAPLFFLLHTASAQVGDSVTFKPLPWQVSLFPGISTHGRADRQMVNHLSLNLIGGTESGLDGVELGGVFNLDAHDVRYIQCAGLLNRVGGKVKGVQAAGLLNLVRDSVSGVQAAGLANLNRGPVSGVQAAGLLNLSHGPVNGVQVAGLYNYTRRLHGVQIGLINVADTSSGYSIGLVNIVHKNGIRQVSVSEEDVTGVSVAFKSGTTRLYGILLAGANDWSLIRNYSAGSGIGTRIPLGSQWSFNGEVVHQELFSDRWKFLGEIVRGKPSLGFKISPHAILSAGPTFNLYTTPSKLPAGHLLTDIPGSGWPTTTWGKQTAVWIGGSVGLSFF